MADFITNTEMKGPYRWDFPLKNKNMEEQPKSPLAIAVANEFKVSRNQGHEDAIRVIKPVFDKMLAALKDLEECEWTLDKGHFDRARAAIKEAEELGL